MVKQIIPKHPKNKLTLIFPYQFKFVKTRKTRQKFLQSQLSYKIGRISQLSDRSTYYSF